MANNNTYCFFYLVDLVHLDPQQLLSGVCGFEQQTGVVLARVRLSREDVEELNHLFRDLELALHDHWPDCKVHPFGSVVTGLGIKTSDADCFVEVPRYFRIPPKRLAIIAKQILNCKPHIYQQLFAITGARVPIVKFFHGPTRRHCDLSFSSKTGMINSQAIRFLMQIDNRILSMTVILKYWSKVHSLCGTNLLPNYALIMMIIFYLQHVGMLPPVQQLQQSVPSVMVDHWNLSYDATNKVSKSQSEISLHRLLSGFFKFYKDYNYDEHVISPFVGYPVLKSTFSEASLVPAEFSLYIRNVREGRSAPLRTDTIMCVQDLFEHNRNCSIGVHQRLFKTFKSHIDHAAEICEKCGEECDNLVGDILLTAPENATAASPRRKRGTQLLRKPVPDARGNWKRGVHKRKMGKIQTQLN